MIVFAIIVFKTTALNRSATGPENLWFPNKLCLFEKLRFPWCPPQRDEWGTPNKRSLFENLKIKDFELQGNFDCKKYAQRYTFRYSEKLPPLGYDGSIAYPRFDRKRVRSFGSQRVPPAKIKDSSRLRSKRLRKERSQARAIE